MKIDTNKTVNGIKLYDLPQQPVKMLADISKIAAADGAVLLKNDNCVLPLKNGEKISVFGRIQFTYYKSGTGSGGMVNVDYVTNIYDSLCECKEIEVNQELAQVYKDWIAEHPFDQGKGWAQEPWCQQEMPLTDTVVSAAAAKSEKAIVVIGRTAGEDKENSVTPGSMLLTDLEKDMLKKVCAAFDKVCVLLNVGNIIDMSFMDEYQIDSVMYLWQGGQEGGKACADLVTGKVTPSGKLPDTIAYSMSDYPSSDNFGSPDENKYVEDIYVGYRYFETVAKDKVRFPFGFGLSYTKFNSEVTGICEKDGKIEIDVTIKNIGDYSGRQVTEVYYGAPQGKLGQPLKQLIAYKKTKLLDVGESQQLHISFDTAKMASYDDSGVTGHKSAYVMEAGEYNIFVGDSVRAAKCSFTYTVDSLIVVKQLTEALSPVKDFSRMHPVMNGNSYEMKLEPVPTRSYDLDKRIANNRPADIEYTGDRGIKLVDVADKKATMEQFIAQLSNDDMACIVRGEGMNSPKVTAGTGSAFGGVTDSLIDFGIPVACTTDGPSGIRMDSGAKATAMPNGTCLASTFDDELVEKLYSYEGIELFAYHIDALLGPGMNIHRHPLGGRNFEYFSEDPVITGTMAAAITRGIHQSGSTSTIKHFCGNNQEIGRSSADSVISERALREIYLKAFEMTVKDGGATSIMTTYGPVNGFWTMGSFDLTTTILRDEWGFDGIVMSDWWAKANLEGETSFVGNLKQMVRAQNDLYMVCGDAENFQDNTIEGLKEGFITRGELQRCAMNICNYIIKAPVFARFVLNGCVAPKISIADDSKAVEFITFDNVTSGKEYSFKNPVDGTVFFEYVLSSDAPELSQISVNVNVDGADTTTLSFNGGKTVTVKRNMNLHPNEHKLILGFNDIARVKKIIIKM